MTHVEHLLRLPEVEKVVGLKRSSLYRMMAEKSFPQGVRLGARAVGWRASDIAAWVDSRPVTGEAKP